MRFTRSRTLLAAAGLTLAGALSACGNAGGSDSESTDVNVEENAADSFEDGTRMKELAQDG